MKKVFILALLLFFAFSPDSGQNPQSLKVFIGVDMEGLAGVVTGRECRSSGEDYDYFRRIMTLETNAAIEGAIAAGATDIVVRDSHGSGRNIFPELLDRNAKLLRAWSGGPKSMMEGIDETFDAVIFIGYHAKAGTPDAIIAHTMSGNVIDVSINGVSLPEAGINALIAGHYDVPVVFLSGDKAICEQAIGLFGEVEIYAVKEGIGRAELGVHPEVAREKIRTGVTKALLNMDKYKPYKLNPPYTMVLKVREEKAEYPGAKKIGEGEFTYTSNDIMDIMLAFSKMH